jgi:hypothetical protein
MLSHYYHTRDNESTNVIIFKCSSGDLRIAVPLIGWSRAEEIKRKYYFDEILYYVHLNVAKVFAKKTDENSTKKFFATKNDKTYAIMYLVASKFKEFL